MSEKTPLVLKDYLVDDLSSCSSSNGFKSFPRHRCCAIVRCLPDIDLRARGSSHSNSSEPPHATTGTRSKTSKSASSAASSLQRATEAVLHAIKLFSRASVKSPSVKSRLLLPRSLSQKLLERSFWRISERNEQGRSFRDFAHDKEKRTDFSPSATITTVTTASSSTINSSSWSDVSEFTSEYSQSPSVNSDYPGENDAVESRNNSREHDKKKASSAAVGEDSVGVSSSSTTCYSTADRQCAKRVRSSGEKEQSASPLSVLDFPFNDEDEEEVRSPSGERLFQSEGKKQVRVRHFHSLSLQLQPALDFEKLPAQLEEDVRESKAMELLNRVKASTPLGVCSDLQFNEEKLLLDFFRDELMLARGKVELELVKAAEEWINGKHEIVLKADWLANQESRRAYVVLDMEEGAKWRDFKEKEEAALAAEIRVLNCLVDELVVDLSS